MQDPSQLIIDESPLAFVRAYADSTNSYLQQAALLYQATTDHITLPIAKSASGPTAYLGAFITVFEGFMSEGKPDQYKLGGIAFLLSKIIPKVNPTVLNHLLDRLSALFITTLKRFADISFLAKVLLQCNSVTLRYLPQATLSTSPACKKLLQALFVFSVDPRPKIRKPAQQLTERVFRTLSTNSVNYIIPKTFEQTFIDFCSLEFQVNDQTSKDCTAALHLCGLLKNVLYCLSTSGIAAIIAPLLQLTAQGNPFLLLQTFYTLASLYTKGFEFSTCLVVLQQSTSSGQTIPPFLKDFSPQLSMTAAQQATHINKDVEFTYQLLLSVLDLKPNSNDVNGNKAFNSVITAMYRVLYSFDPQRAMTKIVGILEILSDTLLNVTKPDIITSTLYTIKHILTITLSTQRLDQDINNNDLTFSSKPTGPNKTPVSPSTRALLIYTRQLFMLPNLDTKNLLIVLDVITATMTHAKLHHFDYFSELIVIVETYHTKTHGDDTIQTACEAVIGDAIQHFGPEAINTILPLNLPQLSQTSPDNTVVAQLKTSRIWLLQLYPIHVRNATLQYFMKNLLPSANDCYQLAITAREQRRGQEANLLHDIVIFVWEAFPAFCLLPRDVVQNFKTLMKEIVMYYNSDQFSSICQQPICKGLRNICAKNLAVVNGKWGKQDDLGLQKYSLDDDDLVLLHSPEQLKIYLNRRDRKGATEDDSDDDEDDEDDSTAIATGEADDDESDDDDDDEEDQLGLYNQTTSIARKRANNRLYNKKQIMEAPITVKEATENCTAIGLLSKNILPLLFNTLINTFSENMVLSQEQSQFIPLVLDTILAYTCTAPEKIREQFFDTAFQQFLTVQQEITKLYNAIDNDQDDEEEEEMPSFDSAMSRPKLADVQQPIRKCRALSDILLNMAPALAFSKSKISLFLQAIVLNFNSPSDVLQKKAYATVQGLITINTSLFEEHWKTVLIAVSTSSANIQTSAHRSRLLLCRSLYSHLQSPLEHKEVLSTLPSLLSESILATKETNNKLRIAALDLTIAIGINIYNSGLSTKTQQPQAPQPTALGQASSNKNQTGQQLLTQYLTMVLAGLAATTPRMLSATINVLARLVFEFKAVLASSMVNDIFQTILILLPSKSREILKAILAFVKVAIVTLPLDLLKAHIHDLLFAMSDWRPQEKSHFKRKVRILYQLLMKKFGLEFMRQATPPDDLRLVEYLRKQQVRQQNQKDNEKKEAKKIAQGEKIINDVFGASNKKKSTKAAAGGDDDGEEDFIDVHRYHSGLSFDEIVNMDNEGEDDDGLGFSAADMLERSVSKQKGKKNKQLDDDDYVMLGDNTDFLENNVASKLRSKMHQSKSLSLGSMGDEDFGNNRSTGIKRKSQGGIVNADGKLDFKSLEKTIIDEERQQRLDSRKPTDKEIKEQRKRQRLLVQQHKEEKLEKHAEKNKLKLGSEFTSAKGAGDVKRRGVKYDPYAYVPLDPRTLNTKKLSLRQQSKLFSGMFENNATTGGTASKRGPGQRLNRAQRLAMKKKGGKYSKPRMEDE